MSTTLSGTKLTDTKRREEGEAEGQDVAKVQEEVNDILKTIQETPQAFGISVFQQVDSFRFINSGCGLC